MASERVTIGNLASAIMEGLDEYAEDASEGVKTAVKNAAKTVRDQVKENAPVKSGQYKKSWSTKNTEESSTKLEVTVYSRNRYQLAHLLEHGHAKRGGGRVSAKPHIADAEEAGIRELEKEIERCLKNG